MLNENYVKLVELSYGVTNRHNVPISYDERIKLICKSIDKFNKPLILDTTGEGLFGINLALGVIKHLGLSREEVKIILGVNPTENINQYEYIVSYTGLCNYLNYYKKLQEQKINWKNVNLNFYFSALARRASTDRALLIKYLLDFYSEYSLVSLGFNGGITNQVKQIMHPYTVPITIDQPIADAASSEFVHSNPNDKILQVLFNIVLETNTLDDREIFVTEKSFKPFAWYQIPIFCTNSEYLKIIKNLGFDTFDDILDNHSYIYTKSKNLQMSIMNLCKKLINKYPTIKDLQSLREDLFDRLHSNNLLLSEYVSRDKHEWN